MKTARITAISCTFGSALIVSLGVIGFFAANQSSMPKIGVMTVSALVVFLIAGITWCLLDVSEHLLMLNSQFIPGNRATPVSL